MGAGFSGAQDILPYGLDEQTALSHARAVPVPLVREVLLTGTPAEILDRAAEWRDCGVRYMVLANIGPAQRSLRNGLATQLPFIQVIRKLKKL